MSSPNVTAKLLEIIVPREYLNYFELTEVKEYPDRWDVELKEKEELIPESLQGKTVVKDGYCNAIQIMSHCFSLKPVNLKLFRRKWKESNSEIHFSNQYELHPEGAKITKELAVFLKGKN